MYIDTSVYLKLLVPEIDSRHFAQLLKGARNVASSVLLTAEVRSALRRRRVAGDIDKEHEQSAWRLLRSQIDGKEIRLIGLSADVIRETERVLESVPDDLLVRSLDAIHLGTCIHSRSFPLVTADTRMLSAARFLKIPVA